MPVNEALELNEASRVRLKMAPGVAVVNRLWPSLLAPDAQAWVRQVPSEGVLAPFIDAARRRENRQLNQRGHVERFIEGAQMPWLAIPERPADGVGHKFVDEVAGRFDTLAAGDAAALNPGAAA